MRPKVSELNSNMLAIVLVWSTFLWFLCQRLGLVWSVHSHMCICAGASPRLLMSTTPPLLSLSVLSIRCLFSALCQLPLPVPWASCGLNAQVQRSFIQRGNLRCRCYPTTKPVNNHTSALPIVHIKTWFSLAIKPLLHFHSGFYRVAGAFLCEMAQNFQFRQDRNQKSKKARVKLQTSKSLDI